MLFGSPGAFVPGPGTTPPCGLAEPGLGDELPLPPVLLGALEPEDELPLPPVLLGALEPEDELPLLFELPEQREFCGNCSHKIFLAAPESLISEGLLLLLSLPLLLDWATATPPVTALATARVRAVPMRVRYFIFIPPTHTLIKSSRYFIIGRPLKNLS